MYFGSTLPPAYGAPSTSQPYKQTLLHCTKPTSSITGVGAGARASAGVEGVKGVDGVAGTTDAATVEAGVAGVVVLGGSVAADAVGLCGGNSSVSGCKKTNKNTCGCINK